jgi:hypothetical protein
MPPKTLFFSNITWTILPLFKRMEYVKKLNMRMEVLAIIHKELQMDRFHHSTLSASALSSNI